MHVCSLTLCHLYEHFHCVQPVEASKSAVQEHPDNFYDLDRLQHLENATKMIEICEQIEEYMAEAFLKLNTMKEHVKHEREHYEKHH